MSATGLEAVLDRRLAALRTAHPELESAISLQELLIRTALAAARPPQAPSFPLPRERALHTVRQGVPLLHDQPLDLDVHFAADLFSRLVNALQQQQQQQPDQQLGPALEAIVEAATTARLDPQQLFAEAFVQHAEHVAELARQAGLDDDGAEVLGTLAHQAVMPILRAYAEHLRPLLERLDDGTLEGAAWQRGYCPICGGWPLLGELRGVELAEFLRCSGCGSGWRWRRLVCPYCGNDDYQSLRSLQIEGEQRFRVSVCERCTGYLKVGNAFDPPPAALLALDDLASLHLDVAAIERGYQRPSGTGFPIELAVADQEWVEELA